MAEKTCKRCKNLYSKPKGYSLRQWAGSKFCSSSCKTSHSYLPGSKSCLRCKSDFVRPRSLSNPTWKLRKYCGDECSKLARRGEFYGDYNAYQKHYRLTHLSVIYSVARSTAERRKLSWGIPYEVFVDLRTRPCFYCGGILSAQGVALDRLDNSAGYELNNVVACCPSCNVWRSDTFTPGETLVAMQAVNKFRQEHYHGSMA